MKTRNLILVVILFVAVHYLAVAAFALADANGTGPEPDPWWLKTEKIQDILLKWIGLLSIVGTALIGAVGALWMLLNNKIKELRERQDRATAASQTLTDHVIEIAKAVPLTTPPTS